VMAAAALPSHIIGKMTKQDGLRLRVVVFKFPSRLPQIREENIHRGQINPAYFTISQQRLLEANIRSATSRPCRSSRCGARRLMKRSQ
ncbi:MAG TPA: hypothetical protein VK567_24115, partial [Bradyrhizobium sp.]|nr:hypothetical protein [Bradyrhizobium sp.]